MSLGDKKDKDAVTVFENYSNGVKSNRDAWSYNFSKSALTENINKSINFYNSEVQRYIDSGSKKEAGSFVKYSSSHFTWDAQNKWDLEKHKKYEFNDRSLQYSLYRPFTKQNLYFNKSLINRRYQMPCIFPNAEIRNRVISVTGLGTPKDFSVIMSDCIPDVQLQANGQDFPEYVFDTGEPINSTAQHSTAQHSTAQLYPS